MFSGHFGHPLSKADAREKEIKSIPVKAYQTSHHYGASLRLCHGCNIKTEFYQLVTVVGCVPEANQLVQSQNSDYTITSVQSGGGPRTTD